MSMVPLTPSTRRISTGGSPSSRGGMKSVTSATPVAVSHRVCRMSVSSAYRLLAVARPAPSS